MSTRISKHKLLESVRNLVREALLLREQGAYTTELARLQGSTDGYMRALVDSGLATQSELLLLVAQERARLHGPAVGRFEPESLPAS